MHAFRSIFWPKLKHAAARIACDSGPSCSNYWGRVLCLYFAWIFLSCLVFACCPMIVFFLRYMALCKRGGIFLYLSVCLSLSCIAPKRPNIELLHHRQQQPHTFNFAYRTPWQIPNSQHHWSEINTAVA